MFIIVLLVLTGFAAGYFIITVVGASCKGLTLMDLVYLITPALIALGFTTVTISVYAYPLVSDTCTELGNYLLQPSSSTLSNFLSCPNADENVVRIRDGQLVAQEQVDGANEEIGQANLLVSTLGSTAPMPPICPLFTPDGAEVVAAECPEGSVHVEDYQSELNSRKCQSNPEALDELDAQLAEGNLGDIDPQVALAANECLAAGQYLGEFRHAELSRQLDLVVNIQEVLADLNGLVQCDVFNEGAVVVLEDICPHVQTDLRLAVAGFGLVTLAGLLTYSLLPVTIRRFKASSRDHQKEYQFTQG